MTTKEKMTMQVNSEFVCNMMKQRNAGTYEKYRSCFRYKKTGELIEIVYPVWTEKGQRLIKEKVNGKRN